MSAPASTYRGFRNVMLVVSLALATLAISYFIALLGPDKGPVVAVAIIGAAIGIYTLINYEFGFYASISLGFFVFYIGRMMGESFPSGLLIDIQIMASFGGLLIYKVINQEGFLKYAKHPITYAYLIYTSFLVLQLFNPDMHSFDGWLLVIRKFLQFLMVYFIALNIFTSLEKIRFFFKFLLGWAFIAGLYGCYQQWFGLFQFELDWIWSVPGRAGLYFLYDGNFRKFSLLSDPAAYGITMAACALVTLVLLIRVKSKLRKAILAAVCVVLLLGVSYSGTRTAYFIITAGMMLYILMTITNRNTLMVAAVFMTGFIFILFAPIYSNTTINRIRSTFEFSDDASMKVRDVNRQNIQPYIYSHPIGGGLATSGMQGLEYNPGHFLAGFPPDSGYIKTAIETGWIGFAFQCLLYFIILQSGVHAFYRSRNKAVRSYYLAVVVSIFSFVIAQFGQEAIGQIPSFFLFYTSMAMIVRLRQIDKEISKQQT